MSEGYAGRTGIVTGAAKGIGAATARALVAAGANAALFDVDDATGQATADDLGAAAAYWSVDVA
ncbi:MAG: SDR family NAD(P)-dependent oxidoreductase, partial [Alphaproteobacteria bacterium]|nr:SDR family NAD(P)-dependent oxidoreductase [Alphaproteobacteria bacterium]